MKPSDFMPQLGRPRKTAAEVGFHLMTIAQAHHGKMGSK